MTRPAASLISRLLPAHFFALAVTTVVLSAATYFLLNTTVNQYERRILHDRAAVAARYLFFRDGRWTFSLPSELRTTYARGYAGYALVAAGGDGRVLYSSLPGGAELLETKPTDERLLHQHLRGTDYYGLLYPVHAGTQTAWIAVAQNSASPDVIIDDVLARFLRQVGWIMLPIFGLLLLLDVVLIRHVMKPVQQASKIAAQISPARPSERLPAAQLPAEIRPLAEAVNLALDRLEKALNSQREFTADAAHEMRTPLAILRTRVDTTLEPAAARELQTDIDAIVRILDQLLELADLEGVPTSGWGVVHLHDICAGVVAQIAPLAINEGKAVELSGGGEEQTVWCNPDMVVRALRNLVENALRFSPPGGMVEVECVATGRIQVRDRGPGVKAEERETIFHRFWRKNRQDKDHSGLGLAIVDKIAQLHGGSITVKERSGGGAIFELSVSRSSPR